MPSYRIPFSLFDRRFNDPVIRILQSLGLVSFNDLWADAVRHHGAEEGQDLGPEHSALIKDGLGSLVHLHPWDVFLRNGSNGEGCPGFFAKLTAHFRLNGKGVHFRGAFYPTPDAVSTPHPDIDVIRSVSNFFYAHTTDYLHVFP